MYKLSATGLKWLKGLHLLAVACWVGGGVALCLLSMGKDGLGEGAFGGGALYGVNRAIHVVDMGVVVAMGAMSCLATGLVYGLFTRWGFFEQGWMIFKWIVTVGCILFGTFYLGEWEVAVMDMSRDMGLAALADAGYQRLERLYAVFGRIQVGLLVVTLFVSVFKPWRGKKTLS
ncbi:hypothetical protein G3N56_17035 [Desulfovibrio sulfodismutans]|uniref:DUF2269 family protein n=1 Tax=Desulfolutivibrio sulfodismutans TaxID=63561 RepID=A0A7K3NQF4_9BACT|nr:hypothetical protein [Desulfolutivibrio sulfodismutans]NDY58440.1 hypothetical protein [Desulfolutivibrio sulfodismutans]QLA14124.1 hypothetical protein GD606_18565 [Desulfolutivibrio sulfodismutans DSM 3696]